MKPGPVYLRHFNRSSKYDPVVLPVELTEVSPSYAYVHYPDGRECTVSLQDLAPCPEPNEQFEPRDEVPPATEIADKPEEIPADTPTPSTSPEQLPGLCLCHSTRISRPPKRLIEEI